jgi:hypothetical protein
MLSVASGLAEKWKLELFYLFKSQLWEISGSYYRTRTGRGSKCRLPAASIEPALSIRRARVRDCLAEVIQWIQSLFVEAQTEEHDKIIDDRTREHGAPRNPLPTGTSASALRSSGPAPVA